MRNAEREIRGVIYGTAVACGYLGQLILCILGGWLFDNVSPQAPFMFVGVLDLIFAIIVIILGAKGIIKNDIKERKAQSSDVAMFFDANVFPRFRHAEARFGPWDNQNTIQN